VGTFTQYFLKRAFFNFFGEGGNPLVSTKTIFPGGQGFRIQGRGHTPALGGGATNTPLIFCPSNFVRGDFFGKHWGVNARGGDLPPFWGAPPLWVDNHLFFTERRKGSLSQGENFLGGTSRTKQVGVYD